MKTHTAGRLRLGSLTLLLAACGQSDLASQNDPYAGGAVHPWEHTAPAAPLSPLALTSGENDLHAEPMLFARNSWGPIEIDRSNGEQRAGDGRVLTLNGKTYPRGFGTHAGSELRFGLRSPGVACTRFRADVGVDDEVGSRGSVVFQVYLDGSKVYDSGVMTGASATKKVDLDTTGRRELRLVITDAGNGIAYDHADWAGPTVSCRVDPQGVRLTSAVGQYDRSRKSFGNYTRFVTRSGRSLPAYYDLANVSAQGQPVASVLCGGDGAVAVRRLSTGTAQPVRYRVEVQSPGEHTLKVFAGDRCPAGGTPLLTQTVQGTGPQVKTLAAGYASGLVVRADGSVVAWGDNQEGQIGDGRSGFGLFNPAPVRIEGLTNIVGLADLLALRADGTVLAWGTNVYGQRGTPFDPNEVSSRPVVVGGLSDIVGITSGFFDHHLALRVDGTVLSWGRNDFGQLGNGTSGPDSRSSTPTAVRGLDDIVAVAGGFSHNLALRADGTVLSWGANFNGQVGTGRSGPGDIVSTPGVVGGLTDVVSVAGGGSHSLALRSDGTVVAWGENYYGQLGNGRYAETFGTFSGPPVTVAGLTGVVAVAGGSTHSLALRGDGSVLAWGNDEDGQLGVGGLGLNFFSETPRGVTNLTGVVAVASGGGHNLALGADGRVTSWGYNYAGQLGDGTRVSRATPAPTLVTGVAQPEP